MSRHGGKEGGGESSKNVEARTRVLKIRAEGHRAESARLDGGLSSMSQ